MKLIYDPRVDEVSKFSLKVTFRNLRNFTTILLSTLALTLMNVQNASSQCALGSSYGSATAPTTNGATTQISSCNYYGEYATISNCLSSNVYSLAIQPSGYVTIYNSGGTAVAWGASPLSFTPPATGTYRAQWSLSSSCGNQSSCQVTTVTLVGPSSACTNPTNAGAAVSTPAAACPGQSINLSLTGAAQGSGLTYQWQSSPAGVTYTNISGATSSSYSIIQSSSTYYRCVVTCASGTPLNSTAVQVNMSSFLNCYCASAASYTNDEEIFNVSLGSLNNSSACGSTGGPGSIVEQYSNYTNATPAVAIPNLTQGFVYPLSVQIGTCGGNYGNMTKVWIDYNQNGLFTDTGEEIYVSPNFTNGPHTETANITIPLTALTGNTRMRVVNVETTFAPGITPCGSYAWGETEDYFVNIAVPLANDAGISGFVNPVVPTCTFNDTVSVTLNNYGTDTLTSSSINWSWNSIVQTPIFWTGSIAPLSSATVYVGTVVYAAGDDLAAWSSNPNGVIESASGAYNDSSIITNLLTGLSGIYTIGGATPDFPDVLTALGALNFAGVCGPTTFNLRSGTYYDQFDLGQVIGMNATNTVTFRSEEGHRDSVTIDYGGAGSTNNYVILMNNADYFHIEQMTLRNSGASYGRVLDISGGSDYNVVYDCAIITQANASTSTFIVPIWSGGSNDNYNTFDGNSIVGGSYGAYWYGSGTSSLELGTVFSNNEFVDNYYTGFRIANQDAVHFTHNRIYGASTYTFRYGAYFYYCDKGSVITHNSIESSATSNFVYPFYMYYCDAASSARGLVANNMITTGNASYTGTNYGMYVYYSGYQNIYNNSVNIVNGSTSSGALYLYNGGANNVKNNTFTNFGGGYAAYVYGTYSINEMDNNNLFTSGTILAYYDNSNTNTLAAWQTASGYDANSMSVNPGYYSEFDLHVCSDSLNNAGTPLALVTDDIDGQMRNVATPDIGADEFAPLGLPGFVGADEVICTGATVNLYAGAPSDDVLWSTGDTTNMLAVTTPGTYTVSVIGACGIAFDTVVISASALTFTGYLMADTTTFCAGGSALLTSNMPATTYSWTGGSSNDSLVVTTGGVYTLNITDACGSGTESISITVNTVPVASYTTVNSFLTVAFTNTSVSGGGSPTYLWNFGDGTTSTAMNPTHVYTTINTFTVTLTVTNDCGTNTYTNTVTSSNLGLEEVNGLGTIAVYPNPSTGLFQIDFNTNADMNITVQVTNVLGESVYVRELGSINGTHKDAIDITTAAPGVYYVTILSNNEKVMMSKLVKQ